MIYLIVGLIICIIALSAYCLKKNDIDKSELQKYEQELASAKANLSTINYTCEQENEKIQELQSKYLTLLDQYKKANQNNQESLNNLFNQQKAFRQSELDTELEQQKRERLESLNLRMEQFVKQAQERVNKAERDAAVEIEKWKKAQQDIAAVTLMQEERFEALLEPLKKYEMKQQERLFYTIQVPDEYREDIDFLLTTVAQKIQHPDIINKLVWTEYVKPYIDETFKRTGIEDKPGIYKLTSLLTGKCYIGKSTNIKKRIADHMKSVVGISTIADQAVHHVIAQEGYWNWTIEPIIYCEKNQLNELEKYYIEFFKSQTFGYNKNSGGGG